MHYNVFPWWKVLINTINFLLMYSDKNFQVGSDINTYVSQSGILL